MAKISKKDWQNTATASGVEFQPNDTIASLQERIAFKLKIEPNKGESIGDALIRESKSADKTDMVEVKCDEIFDEAKRGSIMITVGEHTAWVERKNVVVTEKTKTVSMPAWLAELKGL